MQTGSLVHCSIQIIVFPYGIQLRAPQRARRRHLIIATWNPDQESITYRRRLRSVIQLLNLVLSGKDNQ